MFTPLAIHKNRITELDRLDNSNVSDSTSNKTGGYFITTNSYWNDKNEGTLVMSAFPNSDELKYNGTGTNRFKWMLLNFEGQSAGWFSPCIATDNNIQIGGGSNYTLLDNSLGWKKGQMGIQCRFYDGGSVADGLILINSGSTYDWNNPTPITMAITVDATAQKYSCSINGETATVVEEARSGDPQWTGYQFLSDFNGDNPSITVGYSQGDFAQILMSGSYYEWAFYETPLNQSEMNTITAQPYGSPTNVLDTQPNIHYRLIEENKDGSRAFSNIGSTSFTPTFDPEFQTAGQITSGSVFDGGTNDYRTRL